MNKRERQSSVAARILAFVLCVLLTCSVLLLCGTVTVNRLTASDALYRKAASDTGVLNAETEKIRTGIQRLADEYSFDTEKMTALFTPELIAEFGQRAATWWSAIVTGGDIAEVPSFDVTEAGKLLEADPGFTEGLRKAEIKEKRQNTLTAIKNLISDTVMPVRTILINAAAERILTRLPFKSLLTCCRNLTLPLIAAVFCLSGMLALVMSKKLRGILICLAGSLGASGLILTLTAALFLILNIRGMIGEISGVLLQQYTVLERDILLRIGTTVILIFTVSAAGLILGNRKDPAEVRKCV